MRSAVKYSSAYCLALSPNSFLSTDAKLTNRLIELEMDSGDKGSQSKPRTPSSTSSGCSQTLDAITGLPAINASQTTLGNPSCKLMWIKASQEISWHCMSERSPNHSHLTDGFWSKSLSICCRTFKDFVSVGWEPIQETVGEIPKLLWDSINAWINLKPFFPSSIRPITRNRKFPLALLWVSPECFLMK